MEDAAVGVGPVHHRGDGQALEHGLTRRLGDGGIGSGHGGGSDAWRLILADNGLSRLPESEPVPVLVVVRADMDGR
ncbi:hypothetical protein LG3211_4279 [Lysobacter gummosus]|nr:hypothetical protein LG3211_4279 [Lysobacter gummosus]